MLVAVQANLSFLITCLCLLLKNEVTSCFWWEYILEAN